MTKPIQIRKEEVVRDIRELATLTSRPITEAVGDAVRRELAHARLRAAPARERERRIDQIMAQVRAMQRTGHTLSDEDLYDDDGLPR